MPRAAIAALAFLLLLGGSPAVAAEPGTASPIAAGGDFAGLVEIEGGRRLWLECRGSGSPTVVLEAGYGNRADVWDTIALGPSSGATAVLPGVSAFTRVCAYDRPGTILDPSRRSRSDPAPQPRTPADAVADLHALLGAAGLPGPYVLVGHSIGGIIVRLYTATYPDEVAGLVLVDSAHEDQNDRFRAVLTPEQWSAFARLQEEAGTTGLEDYPELERIDFEASFAQMRAAAAATPLHPLPLVVLSHGRPFDADIPAEALPAGFPRDAFEQAWQELQDELAALVPGARHVRATESGHFIQVEQPDLVIDAIGQVVTAVRDPSGWATLSATPAATGDFAGLVDIGGERRLWLECRGSGSPTVVLESGYRSAAMTWSEDLVQPEAPRTMVLPGVAAQTRVCTYERPGVAALLADGFHPSQSDPVPMPRSADDVVSDLHALLAAAGETGPYVLVGHSLGGLFVRLYAATYPDEVVGMVLVDALSPELETQLTPEQWAIYVRFNLAPPAEVAGYANLETLDFTAAAQRLREAEAASPLPPLPLFVLSKGQSFGVPADMLGFDPAALDQAWARAQDDLASLTPDAHHIVATESSHYIQLEQPDLVIDAIRQVIEEVIS